MSSTAGSRSSAGHLALQVDRDPARARTHAAAARAIGHDSGAIDVEMMALALEGLAYVCEGEVEDGMRRLDEATAAAVAGELEDLDAISSCCCYLIDACKQVRDFERAAQWCEHVKGFCEQWSDRLTFAACRAHYADILIWRGDWSAAEAELRANLGPLADIHPNRISGRDGAPRRAAPPPGAARGGEPAARGGRRALPRAPRARRARARPRRCRRRRHTRPSARCAACPTPASPIARPRSRRSSARGWPPARPTRRARPPSSCA